LDENHALLGAADAEVECDRHVQTRTHTDRQTDREREREKDGQVDRRIQSRPILHGVMASSHRKSVVESATGETNRRPLAIARSQSEITPWALHAPSYMHVQGGPAKVKPTYIFAGNI